MKVPFILNKVFQRKVVLIFALGYVLIPTFVKIIAQTKPEFVWEKNLSFEKWGKQGVQITPQKIEEGDNGDYVVLFLTETYNSSVMKINASGLEQWYTSIGNVSATPVYPLLAYQDKTERNIKFRGLWVPGLGSGLDGVFNYGTLNYSTGDTLPFVLKKGKDDFIKSFPSLCRTSESGYLYSFGNGSYVNPADSGRKHIYFRMLDKNDSLIKRDSVRIEDSLNSNPGFIVNTQDGGYIYCGTGLYQDFGVHFNRLYLVKYDKDLKLEWYKNIAWVGSIVGLVPSEDGGFVVCYNNNVGDSVKTLKGLIRKYSKTGEYEWEKEFSFDERTQFSSIKLLNNKSGMIMFGSVSKKGSTNKAEGKSFRYGTKQFLILTTDNAGNIKSTVMWKPDTLDCNPSDIMQSSDENYVIVGSRVHYSYSGQFEEMVQYPYIAKIKNKADGVENNKNIGLTLTPNPARGRALLGIAENSGGGVVFLYNTLGQEVQRVEFCNETNVSLDLMGLAAGCYNAVIKTKRGVAVKKIIVN